MVVRDLMQLLDTMPQELDIVVEVSSKVGGKKAGSYAVDGVEQDGDMVALRITE